MPDSYRIFEAGGRQSGKTYRIVKELKARPNAIMICATESEARRIAQLGVSPQQVRTLHQWKMMRGHDIYKYDLYVDNIDLMLPELFGGRVVRATYTDARETERPDR